MRPGWLEGQVQVRCAGQSYCCQLAIYAGPHRLYFLYFMYCLLAVDQVLYERQGYRRQRRHGAWLE